MPSDCVSTDGDNTALTADIAMSTDAKTGELSPGTYMKYFVVVPVDNVGNKYYASSSSESGADAPYIVDATVDVDNNNTDSDDTSSGELPGWTWGAIGGVVVVAFIAGAFILSRGGGDGEDKDWDY